VLDFALEFPAHGQVRVSNELRKTGVFVSPSGVRSIWSGIRCRAENSGSKHWKPRWLRKASCSPRRR
jgi:hypothetical protein